MDHQAKPYVLGASYVIPSHKDTYCVKQGDSLFWCFYIMHHGFEHYNGKTFQQEKDEKYMLIDKIRDNKDVLKKNKISNKDGEIEIDMANSSRICVKTFLALCAIFNIRLLFIQKQKAFWFYDQDDDDTPIQFVVKYVDDKATFLFEENVQAIQDSHFRWENIEKPIKSCSSFKHGELVDICQKLHLEYSPKMNKTELYNLILIAIL